MSSQPVPDIVAHKHICPDCNKEHFCTNDWCTSILFLVCINCDEDFYD
jgi:transcription elongation factor Elf1